MRPHRARAIILLAATLTIVAWYPAASQPAGARTYRMGFTPFPYDATLEAVTDTREFLNANADLLGAHFEGAPWTEALSGEPFRSDLAANIETTLRATPPHARTYLAITPLNQGRDGLAAYRGDTEGLPVPEALAGRPFDDPLVEQAFLAYSRRMVDVFHPDYLNIGIEANELFRNSPGKWDGYVRLHQRVYAALKREHPDLPVFVSFTLHDLLTQERTPEQRAAQVAALMQLMPTSDLVAISFYPFMGMLTERVEESLAWLESEFGGLGKPFAVAEMGEIAEPLALERPRFTIPGTPAGQRAVLETALGFADRHDTRFVVWFASRDYDALCARMGASAPPLLNVWRDTGLLDEGGSPRPACGVWQEHLAQPLVEVER